MIVKVYARRESDFACMVDLTGIEDPSKYASVLPMRYVFDHIMIHDTKMN